jgi:hypothetical protein
MTRNDMALAPAVGAAPERSYLPALLLLTFCFHLLMIWQVWRTDPARLVAPDTATYVSPARNLLASGCFLNAHGDPEINRTPGYPLLLAMIFATCGVQPLAVVLIQALLRVGTVALICNVAEELRIQGILWAGVLLALDPASTVFSGIVLSETLFTFLLVLMIRIAVAVHRRPDRSALLGLGATLAAASLVRPIAYHLIGPMLVWVVLFRARGRRFSAAGLVLLPWLILVGGWQVRNYLAVGRMVFSGADFGPMLTYRALEAEAESRGLSRGDAERLATRVIKGDRSDQFRLLFPDTDSDALAQLLRHWRPLLRGTLNSLGRFFLPNMSQLRRQFGFEASGSTFIPDLVHFRLRAVIHIVLWNRTILLSAWVWGYLGILYFRVISLSRGAGSLRAEVPAIALLGWGLIAYFAGLTALSGWGIERYRVPIMPILALLASGRTPPSESLKLR